MLGPVAIPFGLPPRLGDHPVVPLPRSVNERRECALKGALDLSLAEPSVPKFSRQGDDDVVERDLIVRVAVSQFRAAPRKLVGREVTASFPRCVISHSRQSSARGRLALSARNVVLPYGFHRS